jgi:hypothetical protein
MCSSHSKGDENDSQDALHCYDMVFLLKFLNNMMYVFKRRLMLINSAQRQRAPNWTLDNDRKLWGAERAIKQRKTICMAALSISCGAGVPGWPSVVRVLTEGEQVRERDNDIFLHLGVQDSVKRPKHRQKTHLSAPEDVLQVANEPKSQSCSQQPASSAAAHYNMPHAHVCKRVALICSNHTMQHDAAHAILTVLLAPHKHTRATTC